MDLIQSRTVDQSPEPTTIMVLEPGIASIFWAGREVPVVKFPAQNPPLVSDEEGWQVRPSPVGGVQGSALP